VRKIAIRKANRPNPFPGGAAVSYIPLILVVGVLAWFVAAYNKLVRLRNQVRNAWKQIDVQLKRRHDLIPNLVEVVKDYMSYEQETLTKVIEARGAAVSLFALCLFTSQSIGIWLAARVIDGWGILPVFAAAGIGLPLVALDFRRRLARR